MKKFFAFMLVFIFLFSPYATKAYASPMPDETPTATPTDTVSPTPDPTPTPTDTPTPIPTPPPSGSLISSTPYTDDNGIPCRIDRYMENGEIWDYFYENETLVRRSKENLNTASPTPTETPTPTDTPTPTHISHPNQITSTITKDGHYIEITVDLSQSTHPCKVYVDNVLRDEYASAGIPGGAFWPTFNGEQPKSMSSHFSNDLERTDPTTGAAPEIGAEYYKLGQVSYPTPYGAIVYGDVYRKMTGPTIDKAYRWNPFTAIAVIASSLSFVLDAAMLVGFLTEYVLPFINTGSTIGSVFCTVGGFTARVSYEYYYTIVDPWGVKYEAHKHTAYWYYYNGTEHDEFSLAENPAIEHAFSSLYPGEEYDIYTVAQGALTCYARYTHHTEVFDGPDDLDCNICGNIRCQHDSYTWISPTPGYHAKQCNNCHVIFDQEQHFVDALWLPNGDYGEIRYCKCGAIETQDHPKNCITTKWVDLNYIPVPDLPVGTGSVCQNGGYLETYCSNCGKPLNYTYYPAGHYLSYGPWVDTTNNPNGCKLRLVECLRPDCDYQTVEYIPHQMEVLPWVNISTESKCRGQLHECLNCPYSYWDYDTTHDYTSSWVPVGTESVCQQYVTVCSTCGYSYVTKTKTSHNMDVLLWANVSTESICRKKLHECLDCPYSFWEYDNSHDYTPSWIQIGQAAVCREQKETCSTCGYSYIDVVDTTHNMDVLPWVEVSSSDHCRKRLHECLDCPYYYWEYDNTHSLSSSWVPVGIAGVCQQYVTSCSKCNYSYVTATDTSHNMEVLPWVNISSDSYCRGQLHECLDCPYQYWDYDTTHDYVWTAASVAGVAGHEQLCSTCKHAINLGVHQYSSSDWTSMGSSGESRLCTICKLSASKQTRSHSLEYLPWANVKTASTCKKRLVECTHSTCSYSYWDTDTTHSYSSWTSCSSTQHKRTCSDCGYVAYADHTITYIGGEIKCSVCNYKP